jgi:hypothetical protein
MAQDKERNSLNLSLADGRLACDLSQLTSDDSPAKKLVETTVIKGSQSQHQTSVILEN